MDFRAKDMLIDTKGHRRLMKILQTVENDSWQLFYDMNHYNPYSKEVLTDFKDCLNKIHNNLFSE